MEITFDQVKRGDRVKFLEGCNKDLHITVRNRRLQGRYLTYLHATPTGVYRFSAGDCNKFELLERA